MPYVKYTSHHAYASAARGEARRLAPRCDFVTTASSARRRMTPLSLEPRALDAKPHRGAIVGDCETRRRALHLRSRRASRKSTLRVGWADGAYVARRWPRPRPRRAPRRARGPERGEWRRQSRAKPKRGCLGRAAAARGRARAPLARAAAPHHARTKARGATSTRPSCSTTPRSRTRSTCSTTTARARGSRFQEKRGHRARRRGRGRRREPGLRTRVSRRFTWLTPVVRRRPLLSKEPRRSARRARNTSASGRTARAGAGPFWWAARGAANRSEPYGHQSRVFPSVPPNSARVSATGKL